MADTNCKSLIIQNLDPRITEDALKGIFALISPTSSVKITEDDKNSDLNRGFVEFHEHQAAQQALDAMDKRTIYSQEISVNWNYNQLQDDDLSEATIAQILVTNLDPSVNDEILSKAFEPLHMSEARVIMDGEGVVTFTERLHAEEAIRQMDGQHILSSAIHCNWAYDIDDANSISTSQSRRSSTDSDSVVLSNMSYEELFAQTPLYNTTVCISHLPKQAIKQDVASHLQQYGVVSDIFMKGNKAIVKLDTHANAATAIFALQGIKIASKNVRLNWAKDRIPQRVDSQDSLQRSFNVFSSGYIPPSKLVHQITNTYDNHTTMRPPAPTSDPAGGEPGGGLHGWNQYYQQYYSAGHLSI